MWVFALRVLDKGLGLIRLVILARLLAPNDFGLFGIALLAMSALETFSQTGFQTALVQKQGDITPYLDNAWTVSVIRGTFLFIILFLSAPYIALFFNTPEASPIIQVIGVLY
jgi:O-antigen/teichoic acid export membrane protein